MTKEKVNRKERSKRGKIPKKGMKWGNIQVLPPRNFKSILLRRRRMRSFGSKGKMRCSTGQMSGQKKAENEKKGGRHR